jgi:hypothetical protein
MTLTHRHSRSIKTCYSQYRHVQRPKRPQQSFTFSPRTISAKPCKPPREQNEKLELPPEQWSRKYSALHPIVPRVFNFEFRSNEHTRSGHVVFRASGAGEGPQFYWNVGQVRWSIERRENEVRFLVFLCFCDSLTGSSSPSMRNRAMNWSSSRKILVLLLHPSSSRRRRSVERSTLTSSRTRYPGSVHVSSGMSICRSSHRFFLGASMYYDHSNGQSRASKSSSNVSQSSYQKTCERST